MVLLYFVIHNSLIFRKIDIDWCILWPTSKYLFSFFSDFFFLTKNGRFYGEAKYIIFSLSAISTLFCNIMSVLYCHYYSNNFRKVYREIYRYNLLYWFNIGKNRFEKKIKRFKDISCNSEKSHYLAKSFFWSIELIFIHVGWIMVESLWEQYK